MAARPATSSSTWCRLLAAGGKCEPCLYSIQTMSEGFVIGFLNCTNVFAAVFFVCWRHPSCFVGTAAVALTPRACQRLRGWATQGMTNLKERSCVGYRASWPSSFSFLRASSSWRLWPLSFRRGAPAARLCLAPSPTPPGVPVLPRRTGAPPPSVAGVPAAGLLCQSSPFLWAVVAWGFGWLRMQLNSQSLKC